MPVVLEIGEYMYIDSNMGHAYLASGDGPARFICVCTDEASEGTIELLRNRGEGDRAANLVPLTSAHPDAVAGDEQVQTLHPRKRETAK